VTAIQLLEAEERETAARELCRACYDSLLVARAQEPGNAHELAACRSQLAQAEDRHQRVLAQLWRARSAYYVGRCCYACS